MYENIKIDWKFFFLLFLFDVVNGEAFQIDPESKEQIMPDNNINEVWKNCTQRFPNKGCINDGFGNTTVCRLKNCNIRGHDCFEVPNTREFRQAMVDAHNDVRNMVAEGKNATLLASKIEGATNMRAISYDLMLEYLSICVVNNCRMGHDKCSSMGEYEYLGQNLGYKFTNDLTLNLKQVHYFKHIVLRWFEKERVYMKDYSSFIDDFRDLHEKKEIQDKETCGHFAQFLWASISKIGCAGIFEKWEGYDQNPQDELYHGIQVCCAYWTNTSKGYARGNTAHHSIYDRHGAPASKCNMYDEKPNKQYPFLCGEIDNTDIVDYPNPWRQIELDILRKPKPAKVDNIVNIGNRNHFDGILYFIILACLFQNLKD